jgi:hypothetical protein
LQEQRSSGQRIARRNEDIKGKAKTKKYKIKNNLKYPPNADSDIF